MNAHSGIPPEAWRRVRAAGVPGAVEDIPTEHGRRLLVFDSDFYRVEVWRLVFLFCWYIPGAVFVFLLIIWRKHGGVFVSFLIIWRKSPEAWRLVFGFC